MPRAAPIIHRIAPRPAQIPDRFVACIGNVNRGQFTGPQASRQTKSARPRFIARSQERSLSMPLAKASNPLFHRVQIIADRSAFAHFSLAPFLRYRRDDTVFVDIQSKIEFFFHLSVFVCSSCLTATLRNTFVPAVGAALLHLKKGE